MNHEHRFARLRDDALFCECGEIRYVPATAPTVYPVPYPTPTPWAPWEPWPVTTSPNTTAPWIMPPTTTVTYMTTDHPNAGRMLVQGSGG